MNVDDLKDLDDKTRKEIEELEKVTRKKDGDEAYAKAQIDKAGIFYDYNKFENAYQAFVNIKKSDSVIYYMMAQYAMGALLSQGGNSAYAITVWSNLKRVGNTLDAAKIKFRIGNNLLSEDFAKYDEAKQYFIETMKYYPYESYCYQKICELLLNSSLEAVGKKSLQLLDKTLEIVRILKLDFGQESNEDKSPERKLAHYTNTTISNILLEIRVSNTLLERNAKKIGPVCALQADI